VAFDREFVETQLAMKLVRYEDMPKIAWDALEAGLDGRAIRRLAALVQPGWSELERVLPAAMVEMGLREISAEEAAIRFARHRARELVSTGEDPLPYSREFEWLWIQSGYATELMRLGTIDDELYWGEKRKLRNAMMEALRELVG
jgi:hypothetical protein